MPPGWKTSCNRSPQGSTPRSGRPATNCRADNASASALPEALYKQANILFFDEATSALDSRTEEGINRSIAELSQHNRDLTIVVIAHRESSLEYCDRIITLDNNG